MSAAGSKCAVGGCRGRAVAGEVCCRKHLAEQAGGAEPDEVGSIRDYLTAEEQAQLEEADPDSLEGEILLARVAARKIMEAGDLKAVAPALIAVGCLKEMQRRQQGDAAAGIIQAVNQILSELGLGER